MSVAAPLKPEKPSSHPSASRVTANNKVIANNPSVNERISSSFRTGNAQDLAFYFDKQLELLIDSEAVDFSEVRAKHAELILKTFFRKHPPQHFQYVYQGGSAHLRYITGLYQTAGQQFSVYLLMRQDARQRFVINTLHLRKG
jgi:hypothetical protein